MKYTRILTVCIFSILLYSANASANPSRPFPQHVNYAPGTIYPSNFTQAERDQHVRNFYDVWKQRYLVSAGTNSEGKSLYRVAFGQGSNITVSEGQGYGMVIVAIMAGYDANAQSLFDGLWYFSRKYPSGIDNRLMSWKIMNGNVSDGNDSAFDGDVDIAYGLLLAQEQWGNTTGISYQTEANQVMDAILTSTIGATSRLPKLGDWTDDNGGQHNQYTPRSSDFMPSHFHAFARATQDTTWNTVVLNSQAVIDSIQNNYSSITGLLPDFIVDCQNIALCRPADSGFLEGSHDGHYYYNAGRDPWRIGLDALLNNDASSKAQVIKMIAWLSANTGGNVSNIKAGYKLDGTAIGNYSTSFFVAPFAVAAMLDSNQQTFLNDLYTHIYKKHEDYYEDSVNLLSLLALSANYWNPVSGNSSTAACADGLDNDNDGLIDYPADTGCDSSNDNDESGEVTELPLSVKVKITDDWGAGYCAKVFIKNLGTKKVDWKVNFTVDGQVNDLWNAAYSQTSQNVVAEGLSWNNFIRAGKKRKFGFCAQR